MEVTSSVLPFKIGRCSAVPSAQNWQKPFRPKYPATVWRSLDRSDLHGRVAAKKPNL